MKLPLISLLFTALTGVAFSDVPKKLPLSTYGTLWNNSPFTTKPPPATAGPENNPLDDYALLGVSPIGEGKYRVTLINKKKPEDRIMVYSDSTTSEFKILGVTKKAGDPTGTVVSMQSGSMTGTVRFDEKLLTIAAPKPNMVQPGQPPQPGQPVPQPMPGDVRQPRPRVVPPPTPGQPGQPIPQPQVQPGQPGQPGQTMQRPERRRN